MGWLVTFPYHASSVGEDILRAWLPIGLGSTAPLISSSASKGVDPGAGTLFPYFDKLVHQDYPGFMAEMYPSDV